MLRTHRIRLLFAALAGVFFATPLALIAVGVGSRAFENRRLASAPTFADGWGFFDDATRYLIDRMPLRYAAVRANTWIDRNVFATTPLYGLNGLGGVANDQALAFVGRPQQDKAALPTRTSRKGSQPPPPPPATADQVAIGEHGWYYLQGVLDRACSPFIPFTEARARWEELVRVIRQSGRRAELVIPPDKSTIYPEYVAPSTPNLACGLAGTAALWRLIEQRSAVRAGIVGLRAPLRAAKRASHQLLYFRTDSHWNNVGSLTMVQSALPLLSTTVRLLPSEVVDTGPVRHDGDLLGLLGQSGSELAPTRAISRAPGARVVAGRTVVVGDSYAQVAIGELQPYFASLSVLEWTENSQQQVADAIARSHNVILETVEREFDYRATDGAYITPAFIALVRKALASHRLGHP